MSETIFDKIKKGDATTCYKCGDLIIMDSDGNGEPLKEFEELFPGCSKDDVVIICDDCFQEGIEEKIKAN